MYPKSPANSCLGIHRANILPGRGLFRCTDPSNHARRADLAVRRSAKPPERPQPRCRRTARAARARSPDPRNTAREAAPPSLPGQQAPPTPPAYRHCSLPTPASSLSSRRTTLSSPTAPPVETASTPPPPRRFAELRSPKGRAIFPTCGVCLLCSWQMRSAYKRQAEPLLRDYFVMVA